MGELTESDSDLGIPGLRPGDIIDGRVEVCSLVGRGAQGVVLKVHHLEWNQDLALKLPLPKVLDSPVRRERFMREAQTWIRLGVHPNIVRCWFVKQVGDLPGLFLDLIEEGSLQTWIEARRERGVDWADLVTLVLEAAEGLAHAHELGVVHRDVKPANLLIGRNGRIQVSDFGLIKITDEDPPENSDFLAAKIKSAGVTATGEFVGTPFYSAPEQWAGEKVGPTADIYALGTVFFEMLCGRRPFDEPGQESKAEDMITSQLESPAPDPREFCPEVPAQLAELCLRCLHKEPGQRPASMRDLIQELGPVYKELTGGEHNRPKPMPGGERPDLLNNTAVSLDSLGESEEARELLSRGLRIEAGHPQCLYNLVQLERRAGIGDVAEARRRLGRAGLWYPLALLCVEEGLHEEALDALDRLPSKERNGLYYRTRGDAFMYAREFAEAAGAYKEAKRLMPRDQPSQTRLGLAAAQTTQLEEAILFPSGYPCHQDEVDLDSDLRISHDSRFLIAVSAEEVFCLDLEETEVVSRVERFEDASPPEKSWMRADRLLLQEANDFELWSVPELKLLTRAEGRIVTASRDLKRLVLLKDSGLWILDKIRGVRAQIHFPKDEDPGSQVLACFTPCGEELRVLTRSGQLGVLNDDHELDIKARPRPKELHKDVTKVLLTANGRVVITHYDGLLEVLKLKNRQVIFRHELELSPHELRTDASGTVVVASSPTLSTILGPKGEVLLKAHGSLALDANGERCLALVDGQLSLYQLSPFCRLRSWSHAIEAPWRIHIAEDGRRAVTVSAEGVYHVWELDQDNRVYERGLLLTPGQGYSELVQGFKRYRDAFSEAQVLTRRFRYKAAYDKLCLARETSGFYQAEDALSLQWELLPHLQRDRLEAIWERLNTENVRYSSMSGDSQFIALAQEGQFTIWSNAGSQTTLMRTIRTSREFLGVHFVDSENGMLVAYVDRKGSGEFLKAKDGSLVSFIEFGCGKLRQVAFKESSIFFVNEHNLVGHYDLGQAKITSATASVDPYITKLFPLRPDHAVVATTNGPLFLDLAKEAPVSEMPLDLRAALLSAGGLTDRRALLLGLSDGTVVVADEKNGKVLFGADLKAGGVTGFDLAAGLALGVAATDEGQLTLWDLGSGEVLEQFVAHSVAILDLQMSSDGRYLTTIDSNGQFRLWETSWTLTDGGPPTVGWLSQGALKKLGALFKMRIGG